MIRAHISDPLFIDVRETFKNLSILFDYINLYSEDPFRIKVDTVKEEIKIVKNEGITRKLNPPPPELRLPLKRKVEQKVKPKSQI
jgi:hypothetical protein